MKPSITYESWVALNAEIKLADKERTRMSMPWRIWELSLARINNYGHAAFHLDELTRLACGKVSKSDRDAVRRGLHVLADMGRIAPPGDKGSTLLCVMVNTDIAMRSAGKGNYKYLCSEPSHMDIRQTPYSPQTLDPEFTAPPMRPEDEEELVSWPNAVDPWDDAWPSPETQADEIST